MTGELTCRGLCGRVRYTLADGFRFLPSACHCTDCQARTGSAFSEHILFARDDLTITSRIDNGDYTQPSSAHLDIEYTALDPDTCRREIDGSTAKHDGRMGRVGRSIVTIKSPRQRTNLTYPRPISRFAIISATADDGSPLRSLSSQTSFRRSGILWMRASTSARSPWPIYSRHTLMMPPALMT